MMIKKIKKIQELDHRNVVDFVIEKISKIPKNSTIIDIGAGLKPFKNYCKHLQYYSHDFDAYKNYKTHSGSLFTNSDVGNDNQEYKYDFNCDILEIPENKKFDTIICTEVIEHLKDIDKTFKKFSILLKNKGTLILTFPFASMYHQEPHFYVSGYSKYLINYLCKKNNLMVLEYKENGTYPNSIQLDILRASFFYRENSNLIFKYIIKFFTYLIVIFLSRIEKKNIKISKKNKIINLNKLKPLGYLYYIKKI